MNMWYELLERARCENGDHDAKKFAFFKSGKWRVEENCPTQLEKLALFYFAIAT